MASFRSLASLPLFGTLPDSVVGASSLMGLFSRSAVQALHRVGPQRVQAAEVGAEAVHRGVRGGDAGGDADAVVGGPTDGEARQPADVLADPGHARVVAHRVLGQS